MGSAVMFNKEVLGFIYAISALVSFSLSPLLYKIGLGNRSLHVVEANTLRTWGSLVLLTPLILVSGFSVPTKMSSIALLYIVSSAILGPILGDTLYMYAIRNVGVSIATPLANSYSLIVTLVSVLFYGEKLSLTNVVGGFLIILSLWILYYERKSLDRRSLKGMVAGLGTALMWSLSIISMKQALALNINPTVIIYIRTFIVALMLTLLVKARGYSLKGKLYAKTFLILSIGGFFGIGFGVITFLYAISILGAGRVSLIASASPVIATLLAIILLKEKFRIRAILAVILVSLGAVLLK